MCVCLNVFLCGLGVSLFARHEYSADLEEGPKFLRPWMLAFRGDFGLSQMQEPDQLIDLAEMFLMEGFLWQQFQRLRSQPAVQLKPCLRVDWLTMHGS